MDTETHWEVSEDTSGLLEAISLCKRELTKACFAKFGCAKILEYSVCAPYKVCEILMLTEGHVPIKGKHFDSYCYKALADFESFRLFKTKMHGDGVIRLETKFDVGEGVGKYWYGNITII